MRIPQIKIDQQFAQLGLNIKPGEQTIKQKSSRVNVDLNSSQLEIKYHKMKVDTNWQPVWDDIGLKKPATIIKEVGSKGYQKGIEVIGQIARDGDRLGNIASGKKNVPGNLAKEKFFRDQSVETQIQSIPRRGPEFKVVTKSPEIDLKLGDVKVNPNNIEPIIDYKVGDVGVYWVREPRVDIYV